MKRRKKITAEKPVIKYKSGTVRLRKFIKEKITSIKHELKMEGIEEIVFSDDEQIQLIESWKNYFREETNFSFKDFETLVEEPVFIPKPKLFATAIEYRQDELYQIIFFYRNAKIPLNKKKSNMFHVVNKIVNTFLYEAVAGRYPELLMARCLVYINDIIDYIDSNTKSTISLYNGKTLIAKMELEKLWKLEEEQQHKEYISLKEYLALKQEAEEEKDY